MEQNISLQLDALAEAGCERIFEDMISGTKAIRPGLQAALKFAKSGDTRVVWRLDRLGRSLKHLIEMVSRLEERGTDLRSLHEALDTKTALLYKLRDEQEHTVKEICHILEISKPTFYTYLKHRMARKNLS